MQKVLEKAYEAGKVTEDELLDGVMALEKAEMWMGTGKSLACFERAQEGFDCLLVEGSAKAVEAAYSVAGRTLRGNEQTAGYRRL